MPAQSKNSFGAESTLTVGDAQLRLLPHRCGRRRGATAVQPEGAAGEPAAHRGRHQRHRRRRSRRWPAGNPTAEPDTEIQFTPARVVMQDFTGVPAVVDLATMREAVRRPRRRPDHDQPAGPGRTGDRPLGDRRPVRHAGRVRAQRRARVRAQPASATSSCAGARPRSTSSRSCRPAPASCTRSTSSTWPGWSSTATDGPVAYPDTLVGTDSHTTMVNGLGVLGWGVGGIEAEAAMLGQPVSMLIPRVVGFKLTGELPDGSTATDLVLTITEMLRKHGVVGKFVEFYGPGVAGGAAGQPRHDRQHEPGVRLDLRDLPDRRRDAALPALHRPQGRAGRAGRGVRQGERPLARPGRRAGVLRDARAGPVDDRAVARRPEAAAGPRAAEGRQARCSARRSSSYVDGDSVQRLGRRGGRRVLPGLRPGQPRRARDDRRARRRRTAPRADRPSRRR